MMIRPVYEVHQICFSMLQTMLKNRTLLIFILTIASDLGLHAQANNRIRMDTILLKTKVLKSPMVSNLNLIASNLDSNMVTSMYWYDSNEQYDFDHTGILKKLNKKLSTRSFSGVSSILFFCINNKNDKPYLWTRVEEWHFSTAEKAKSAFDQLKNLEQSGIISVRPIHWTFILGDSKIYYITSEYFDHKSEQMKYIKASICSTLSISESFALEYSR